jgi:hypothetical protein
MAAPIRSDELFKSAEDTLFRIDQLKQLDFGIAHLQSVVAETDDLTKKAKKLRRALECSDATDAAD